VAVRREWVTKAHSASCAHTHAFRRRIHAHEEEDTCMRRRIHAYEKEDTKAHSASCAHTHTHL
jgi:hypothetical protein